MRPLSGAPAGPSETALVGAVVELGEGFLALAAICSFAGKKQGDGCGGP